MATVSEAILAALDLRDSGRTAEAEALCCRALAAAPDHAGARVLLGVLLAEAGRTADAIPHFRLAQALAPDRSDSQTNLGEIERSLGRSGAAALHFRRAALLGADDAALVEVLAAIGREALEGARPRDAEPPLAEAARRRPSRLDLAADLAAARCDLNDHEGAIRALHAVLVGVPARHPTLHDLGVRERLRGRVQEAARAFRRADAVRPDHPETTEHLAEALFHAGRREEARAVATAILRRKDREARGEGRSPPLPPRSPRVGSRRVVALSLWGGLPIHLVGALENVRALPDYLPGWECRIYHDDSVPIGVIADLRRLGAETVMMEPGGGPRRGSLWRFLVADDPEVDLFVCRDADSRPNARETAAVREWLDSGRTFHVMRDHILHTELMMAGMWGGRAGFLPPLDAMTRTLVREEDGRFRDQRFLARHVWPLIADHALIHDSAHPGVGTEFPDTAIDAHHRFEHVGARVEVDEPEVSNDTRPRR